MKLNRKKEQVELTINQKAEELLKRTNVPTTEFENIMQQINSIIDELDAIGQPIDELEIVTEVLEQNDYEFNNSNQGKIEEKTLKIKTSGREVILTNEPINKLNLEVKFGGALLDLRDFEFNGGDLLLNVKGSYCGIEIYINEDVQVQDWVENKYSGVNYNIDGVDTDTLKNVQLDTPKHIITLEGKLKGSGLTFRYGHEGEYVNGMSANHHGYAFQNRTKEQVEARLQNDIAKHESRFEKRKIKLKNRAQKKLDRLNK